MITSRSQYFTLVLICTLLFSKSSVAEIFPYTAQIDSVLIDNGKSLFSEAVVGDYFHGGINVDSADGTLFLSSSPQYFLNLNCCVLAEGVETTNDLILDEATVALYNQLLGTTQFSEGDVVDVLRVGVDTIVPGDTRIEVVVRFVLFNGSIVEGQPYTFDEGDIILTTVFVSEESMGVDIFLAYGLAFRNTDGDSIPDFLDNCSFATNPDQLDSDGDGFGNACDPDIDNNCVVNFLDFAFFPPAFSSQVGDPNYDINMDLNEDGVIGFLDLHRFVNYFGDAPGPSAVECP